MSPLRSAHAAGSHFVALRLASTLLAASASLTSVAAAQVFNCGDTIGPKAKVTLTADIETCTSATQPALTIIGPATVDMAGFRVRCDPNNPPAAGIQINGKGVKLRTGGVINCGTGAGIFVAGEGKHKLEDFAVEDANNDGIRIVSDKNTLKRVSSNDNGGDGIELDGDGNKLEDVVTIGNGGDGFETDSDKNQFKRITATGNDATGMNFDGGMLNKVKEGVFIGNDGDGINVATAGNKIEKSVVATNTGDGVEILADNTQLKKSRAYANTECGVDVTAQNNTMSGNTSLGHGCDMNDDNATCDNNKWKKNVFGISEAGGVAGDPCID